MTKDKKGTILISNLNDNIDNTDIMNYVNEDIITETEIEKAIEDLSEINENLNKIIQEQNIKINNISQNIENSQESVNYGKSQLEEVFKLDKRNTTIYIGASIGGIIGSFIPFLQGITIPSGILIGGYLANKLI